MHGVDWRGLATMLGAVGGFCTVIGTLVMQVISFRDARRARIEQEAHKEKLDAISDKVDTIARADT